MHIFKIIILLIVLLTSACGLLPRRHKIKQASDNEVLLQKYQTYLPLVEKAADEFGFVKPKCDSLLFTSLAAVAGANFNPGKAEKSPGEWHRHPSFTCYPDESASSISKDMILGVMHYAHKTQDKAMVQRIIDYGKDHSWFMGVAKDQITAISRTLLSPNMIFLLYDIVGNKEYPIISLEHEPTSGNFEGHLNVLRLYLSGLVHGGIDDIELATLREYASDYPRNALYCAIYGKFHNGDLSRCAEILLDESLFPLDSLPTSSNYCTDYLWQRSGEPADVNPCPEQNKVHPGVDFIYAASIILN